MKLRNALLVCLSGLLTVAACGGSTKDGSKISTGLPPSMPLNEMSDEDALQSCESLATVFTQRFNEDTSLRLTCTALGLATTQSAATCNAQRNDCIAEPPAGLDTSVASVEVDCTDTSTAEFASCSDEISVSDFELCLNDVSATLNNFINQFSCEAAGDQDTIAALMDPDGPELPPSCKEIEAACPGVSF